MLRASFALVLVLLITVSIMLSFKLGLAQQDYYRGIYSACMGLLVPSERVCMDVVSQAYEANFWSIPDEGFVFPPPLFSGQRD